MSTYRNDLHTGRKVPLIETDDILKGAVTTDKIADQAITGDKLDPNLKLPVEKFKDNSIPGSKLEIKSLTGDKFVDKTITGDKIAEKAVTREKIADEAVEELNGLYEEMRQELTGELNEKEGQIDHNVSEFETSVNQRISSQNATIANKLSQQDQHIDERITEAVEQISEIPNNGVIVVDSVDDIPSDASPNAVYRVPGADNESYTDYAVVNGVVKPLATYSPGIDDKPTPESNNLVKSGGIADMYGHYEENPEFVNAITDNEGKLLFALRKEDGKPYFPQNEMYHVERNPEWLVVWLDSENKVLMGIKSDGNIYGSNYNFTEIIGKVKAILDGVDFSIEDNPEWLQVELDSEGRVLSGTKSDGSHYIHNVESETIPTAFSEIDDIENRMEIKVDVDKRLISERDETGMLHENVGVKTPVVITKSLNLSSEGMTEFQQALKNAGFQPGGGGDYTDSSFMQIPMPRLAFVNIINPNGEAVWPSTKTSDCKYLMEFYDGAGNYFKKEIIFNAQGNSSMAFEKKNGKADFCNNNGWDDDDTFEIKIGDWVTQDSFHFKAYHTDFIRGAAVVAYQFADMVYKSRGSYEDRPWKKALIDYNDFEARTPAYRKSEGINDLSLQMDNGARCMPDGFPAVFYLNGDFYGIFSWQLSKNRKNYHLDKSNPEHVHIDGTLRSANIWNGSVTWTSFEVRNPKNLYCMDGSKYDGDNPKELMDNTSEYYDSTNKNHKNTAKVKQYILDLSQKVGEINALTIVNTEREQYPTMTIGSYKGTHSLSMSYNRTEWVKSESEERFFMCIRMTNVVGSLLTDTEHWQEITNTIALIKSTFERYFDIDNIVDYQLINMAIGDSDGFGKNWQWITYDGVKWYVNQYDKDMAFGNQWTGMFTTPPMKGWIESSTNLPIGIAIKFYPGMYKKRWSELVGKNIINAETIKSLISDWVKKIGEDIFEKEWKRWPEAPCNRDSKINFDYWIFDGGFSEGSPAAQDMWNAETHYNVGEKAWFAFSGNVGFVRFECIESNTNQQPLISGYSVNPTTMGYRDSIWRMFKYVENTISNQNSFIEEINY